MGIKYLSKKVRDGNKRENTLEDLRGNTLGIDVSNFMFRAMKNQLGVDQFHTRPRQPSTAVLKTLQQFTALCRRYMITQVWVFDGAPHGQKKATHLKRYQDIEKKQRRLNAFMKQPTHTPKDCSKIKGKPAI